MRDKSVLLAIAIAVVAVLIAVWRIVSAPSTMSVEELKAQETVEGREWRRR